MIGNLRSIKEEYTSSFADIITKSTSPDQNVISGCRQGRQVLQG
jgi:hypothetical protein